MKRAEGKQSEIISVKNLDSALSGILTTVLWKKMRRKAVWKFTLAEGLELGIRDDSFVIYISLSLFLSDEKTWASAEHAECGERNRKFYKAEKLF